MLDIIPFVLHRQVQRPQGALTGLYERHIVHGDGKQCLSVRVHPNRLNLRVSGFMQAVVHLQFAVLDTHLFVTDARRVVVVEILLVCGSAETVGTCVEHRMAEQIRTIAIGLYLCQQHRGFGVVDRLPFHRFLAVVSHFHAVLELRAGDGNRIVIRDAVHRIRRHFVVVVVEPNRIRRHRQQIQRLAGLTSSIERRIASCGGLRNLVLHGIEVGAVLTGLLIRTDDDAFLRIDNLRRTRHDGIARRDGLLLYRGANRIQGRILRVVNDLRDIVAFQFQYQLQVIAQVVRTQAEAKDLVGLVLAADETTRQPHFRLVVHVYAIQGILQPQGAATVDIHESVSGKRVTGLEHLQREGVVLGHLDREIARTVGLVNRITGAHDLSIQFQARIAHRYRRVLVQHASAEANGRDVLLVGVTV